MTLGEKISALRAARGMKQDELAAALGVSRQSVSLLGLYLSFCGALCLLIKRRPGLVIGWLTLAALIPFTWRFTSIRMFGVFSPAYYKYTGLAAQLLSWAMWLYLAALIAVTARAAKRPRK